jgi:hypothetical protein
VLVRSRRVEEQAADLAGARTSYYKFDLYVTDAGFVLRTLSEYNYTQAPNRIIQNSP